MMTFTIEALKRLDAEATPGEWDYGNETKQLFTHGALGHSYVIALDMDKNDAALIVAMRNALPELLKALEWQRMDSAPTDGTAVDLWMEDGSRATDFHMDVKGRWVRKEGYPTVTRVLLSKPTAWRPLPLPPHGVDYAS